MEELRIILPEYLVMDGQKTIPSVGDRVEYLLEFQEAEPARFPEASNQVEARVEDMAAFRSADLDAKATPEEPPLPYIHSHVLHGSKWCAAFTPRTPVASLVRLVGIFEAAFPGTVTDQACVAGTVTDCMLITRTSWPDPHGRYLHGGAITLRPVPAGQAGFQSGLVADVPDDFQGSGWFEMIPPRDGPWICEEGVLVTLKVDDTASHT